MSFDQTRTALIDALLLPNTPVIALHGLWGTGKTYLWRETAQKLEELGTITHLYVSCTAYGTITALKSAVITILLSRSSSLAKHGDQFFKLLTGLLNKKLPKEFQLNANPLDIQALLPILKGMLPERCLIVFDDIERATALDIRELLGFVSFLTEQLDVRVLLILNKDKLGERQKEWEQLREKIISIEIALKAEPSECIAIGIGGLPSAHSSIFADRIGRLGVTNIRVLQHMRRAYEALATRQIADEYWLQFIPSIVLFVSLYFNALDNGPTVEQMLAGLHENKDTTEEQKKAIRRIEDYKFGIPDNFELKVLVPYLRTGYLDTKALSDYIHSENVYRKNQETNNAVLDFFKRYHWDDKISKEGLLAILEEIRSHLNFISDRRVTELAELTMNMGEPDLANALVDDWIKAHRSKIAAREVSEHGLEPRQHLGYIHPKIQALYKADYDEKYPPIPLHEAIEYLYLNSSWGPRQSRPIENATQAELESLIRTSEPDVRMHVFEFFSDHLTGRVQGGSFYASANRFAAACRNIVTQEPESRLTSIIRNKFDRSDLAKMLEEPTVPVTIKTEKDNPG